MLHPNRGIYELKSKNDVKITRERRVYYEVIRIEAISGRLAKSDTKY